MLRHDTSLNLESKPELSTKGINEPKKNYNKNAKKSFTYPWKATNKKANKNKACTKTVICIFRYGEYIYLVHRNIICVF